MVCFSQHPRDGHFDRLQVVDAHLIAAHVTGKSLPEERRSHEKSLLVAPELFGTGGAEREVVGGLVHQKVESEVEIHRHRLPDRSVDVLHLQELGHIEHDDRLHFEFVVAVQFDDRADGAADRRLLRGTVAGIQEGPRRESAGMRVVERVQVIWKNKVV